MSQVSARGFGSGSPPFRRKSRSNPTLCPTIGAEPMKAASRGATSENGGAASTSSWLMPV